MDNQPTIQPLELGHSSVRVTLENLVAQNKTPEAMQRLTDLLAYLPMHYNQQLVILQGRSKRVKWTEITNMARQDDISLEENRINHAFLSLLNELRHDLERNLNFYNTMPAYPTGMVLKGPEQLSDDQIQLLTYIQSRLARRYHLKTIIKAGTSVVNILATDLFSKRDVVIKVLKTNEIDAESVEKEVQLVARLRHRNIMKIMDVYFDDYPYFVVTEYIWGLPLDEILKKTGYLPYYMTVRILTELCDTLEYIRQWNILHSSIRPSKIMLDEEGRCMISPFEVIKSGSIGRPLEKFIEDCRYVGPELLIRELLPKDMEEAEDSDQFSLATTAYEILTGRPLFDANNVPELVRQRDRFFARKSLKPYIPKHLDQPDLKPFWTLLERMLQKDPQKRFKDLHELSKALAKLRTPHSLHHDIALASYNRCLAAAGREGADFIERFYENFFTRLPEARQMFSKDMDTQHRMFRIAVRMFLDSGSHVSFFEKLAALPAHQGISLPQYEQFLDAFRETVAQHDPYLKSNSQVEPAWDFIRDGLREGIRERLMKNA